MYEFRLDSSIATTKFNVIFCPDYPKNSDATDQKTGHGWTCPSVSASQHALPQWYAAGPVQ